MNCGFTEKISSLIDGELSPAEAREVERHLVMCAQCAETRADFLSLRSQIAGFEPSLTPAVQNRALAKILSMRSRERQPAAFGFAWKWTAIGFASILIVALSILLIPSKQPQQVAVNKPAPASSPTPAPTIAPSEAPRPQQPQQPRRKPLVREPKPGEQFAVNSQPQRSTEPQPVRPADAQTMTALHFEKAETLLRAFRNVRLNEPDSANEVSYERQRARQLVYQNMMLRREADANGDVQISSVLESLEPILLDIANLPDKPDDAAVRVIRERVERKNIVGLLQVNSTALARALD
ncbi:MAG TPA: zf-HC2 domain-containing protein [Pyrinomonadaceae bacterium]